MWPSACLAPARAMPADLSFEADDCASAQLQCSAEIRNREGGSMSKVFANIGLSLDGYMAPEGMSIEYWDRPDQGWVDVHPF